MRVARLDLLAYGPFTAESIDFGQNGLDVVYGLNEAGKSSALRALGALLFGIPARTSDNFMHDYKNLRVGGKLVLSDGRSLEFLRRKGNKNTLLGPDGKTPIPDGALSVFIGAVGEELYGQLFGLDHHTLVEGGRVILDGKGELGESLLAAGTGGASVRRLMQALEEECEALFKPHKRSASGSSINSLLLEYEAARKRIGELSLSAAKWEEMVRDLERAEKEREGLAALLAERASEKERLERLSHALPVIARRSDLLEKLEALGEVVQLPADFGKRRREAEDLLLRAGNDLEKASRAVGALEEIIGGLDVPTALLSQEENIAALYRRLGSHHKALDDLPQRENDRGKLLDRARALMYALRPDLSLEDAASLRAGLSTKARVRELAGEHGRIATRIDIEVKGITEDKENLEALKERLERLDAPRDISALKAALESFRAEGDLARLCAEIEGEIERETAQARVELRGLPLWQGTLEGLEALTVPAPETVDRFDELIEVLRSELGEKERDIERVRRALEEERRKIERISVGGTVPDEESLRKARAVRDSGWSLVKRAWLKGEDVSDEAEGFDAERPLPEAYEKRVAEADDVADRMRAGADRAALLAQSGQRVRELEDELRGLQGAAEGLRARLDKAEGEWAEAWKEAGMTPLTPREMRSWLGRRAALVQAARRVREMRQRLDGARERVARHTERLCALLGASGVKVSAEYGLETLARQARDLCERVERTEAERKNIESLMREQKRKLDSRGAALEVARGELEIWKKAWAEAMAVAGLPADTAPGEALSYLDRLEELFRALGEAEGHGKRIEDIRRDAESFREDVSAFVSEYAPDLSGTGAELAVAELHARLLKAKEVEAEAKARRDELEARKREAARAEADIREAETALAALCRQAGCSSPQELEEAERKHAEHGALRAELEELEKQLLPFRKGEPVEKLLAEAAEVDADTLPSRIAEIEAELAVLAERRSRLDEEIGGMRSRLGEMVGGEAAALEAERAEAALAALRPLVERFATLRAASLLLRQEVERYSQNNQDPLLARAGEAFSVLTAGYFRGLELDYGEDDRPVIVGVRASGEKVGVEGMSDGTCDQLYLALRIASIEAFLEGNEPFPFIVDDILIRFDDQRAKAAIQALLGLSLKTQVIFFTHHAHLVEIAREVAGGDGVAGEGVLTVHELKRP